MPQASGPIAQNLVLIVHYFPPVNSTGGKRMEAMAKYFARAGRSVTVITTQKRAGDGVFSEQVPEGVRLLEMNAMGQLAPSVPGSAPAAGPSPAKGGGLGTRIKRLVQRWFGQLPDPRLPFALGFLSPWLAPEIKTALQQADFVVSSMPPWPTHLASLFVKWRFARPIALDYRDHFSENHIMAGSAGAKWMETQVDRYLARRADLVVVISQPMADYYVGFNPKVKVILNGYDPEAFDAARLALPPAGERSGGPIVVRYLGAISRNRIPRALLAAVQRLVQEGRLAADALRFEFYGECSLLQAYVDEHHAALRGMFVFAASVPYQKALQLMLTADYLLFSETSDQSSLSAKGVLTTKLFEYLATGRPILAEIATDTEAGRLMLGTGGAHIVSDSTDDFLVHLTSPAFRAGAPSTQGEAVSALSRRAQATDYMDLLDAHVHGARR